MWGWNVFLRKYNLYFERNVIECQLIHTKSLAQNGVYESKNFSILAKDHNMCLKSGVPNYLSHETRNMLGPIC